MKDFWEFINEANKNTKNEKSLEFFDKRMAGAQKISTQAKKKGGPSLLTHYHFAAKIKQYEDVEEAIKQGKDEQFFNQKYQTLLSQLKTLNMTQKEFQTLSGELEVWGESIVKLFSRKNYE